MVSSSGMAESENRWRRSSSVSSAGERVPFGGGGTYSLAGVGGGRGGTVGRGSDDLVAEVRGGAGLLGQEILQYDEPRPRDKGRHRGRIAHPHTSAARSRNRSP